MPKPVLRSTASQLRLTAILGPVVLFDLALQTARIVDRYTEIVAHPEKMEALDWLSLLLSTLFFHFGLALFGTGLLRAGRDRPRDRRALQALLQIAGVLTVAVNAAAHVYFLKTGSSLDFAQVAYAFGRFTDLSIVADLISPGQWLAFGAFAVLLPAAPILATRLLQTAPEQPGRRFGAAAGLLGGLAVAGVGFLPLADQAVDRAVVRDPVLNLFATSRTGQLASPKANVRRFSLVIERARPIPRKNVVIIMLESTRAISMAPWAPLETTPFFAELARKSLLVERAYAVMPSTSKALVASLCGIEPSHSVKPLSLRLGMLERCLPALLADEGYASVFFQSADSRFEGRIPTTTGMGFGLFVGTSDFPVAGFERANFLGYEDEVMLGPSEQWLRSRDRGKPFLATYLTVAAHHQCFPVSRHGIVPFTAEIDLNLYLNALRDDDFFLRGLFDQYKRLGLYEDTVFVVLGDHGEGFGEHGRHTHNDVPYEEGLHIPMLLHDPGGRLVKPGIWKEPVSQLDLLPTLIDLLGYRITKGKLPGFAIGKRPRERALMSACLDERTCLVHLSGTEKLIHHFGRQPEELFDLATDPHEKRNLAAARPRDVEHKLGELLYWDSRVASLYWGEGLLARTR